MVKNNYGIVVDSGSSGSRVQIYSWPDSNELVKDKSTDKSILSSVPQIYQEESWTFKITPGVSTFGDKPDEVWDDHYEALVEYAEKIIPKESWKDTPIFILATAGMRLLPEKKRETLLNKICKKIGKHSDFKLINCEEQVQIIDGETEGLYGWIGLNYLMGQLNDYQPNQKHTSYGFMDMGGASTQISFVPNKESEAEKHADDISNLYLRNINGEVQQWNIFVSTWLGFGANEARKRHLKNLVNMLPEKNNDNSEDDFQTTSLYDPCLPKGAALDFLHYGHSYDISGSGDYEQCLKITYPLLSKHLPCTDDPCLFNGVHAPEIDFYTDKFVGISEYWYTANDVFHMGGEYNFERFNEKVKEFCETDWSKILENSAKGDYNNVPNSLLMDACFKANWVLNILHEGFNLPRGGIETTLPDSVEDDTLANQPHHIPFQSAGTIKGSELSWTLGRILLYASSLIKASDKNQVGFQPSLNEHKDFVPGGLIASSKKSIDIDDDHTGIAFLPFIFVIFLIGSFVYMFVYRRQTLQKLPSDFQQIYNKLKTKFNQYQYTKIANQESSDLENGTYDPTIETSGTLSPGLAPQDPFNANLRTRSFANLQTSQVKQNAFQPKKLKTANSLLDFSKFRKNENNRNFSASSFLSPE